MTVTLPPQMQQDFAHEAQERGVDTEIYTEAILQLVMETFRELLTKTPDVDESQVLLMMSRLENETPKAWREADNETRLKWGLFLLATYLAIRQVKERRSEFTAEELMRLPLTERRRIMAAQAKSAQPLYQADAELPEDEQELTLFARWNHDAIVEPDEYLARERSAP